MDTALRLNPNSSDILAIFGEAVRGAEMADQAMRLNPNYPTAQSGAYYFAYFMAGRYEDALRVIDKQPIENRTMYGWVMRAATLASLGEGDKAKAAAKDALTRFPDLTAEGFGNEAGILDSERKILAEATRDAGFPPCAPAAKLASFKNPYRLPECLTQ